MVWFERAHFVLEFLSASFERHIMEHVFDLIYACALCVCEFCDTGEAAATVSLVCFSFGLLQAHARTCIHTIYTIYILTEHTSRILVSMNPYSTLCDV